MVGRSTRKFDGFADAAGDWRKISYQVAPDFRASSRRDNRRIVELCNCWRNTEDGRKDKQDGMRFNRNRLNTRVLPVFARIGARRALCLLVFEGALNNWVLELSVYGK